jgi:hypothetical protein
VETIVVEVPARFKRLVQAVQAVVETTTTLEPQTRHGRTVDMVEIEGAVAEVAAQVERAMLGEMLSLLDVDAPRVMIGGREHTRVGRYPKTYYGMAGPFVVEHSLYRRLGERNGPTVDPIALRAGLVEGAWLPGAACAIAQRIAIGTSREAEAISKLEHRLPYSRTSFEEVAHAVGRRVVERRAETEQELIELTPIPAGTKSIALSLDRAAMAFEEPRPKPVGRPRKGAPKRPISRVFHMAWSGTLTFHDAKGEVLDTIHYGREPSQGAMIAESVVSDALAIRARAPGLPITVLCDGAHELWNLLEPLLEGVPDVTFTVDFWHVAQKLAAAASVVASSDAQGLVGGWKTALLNRRDAPERILRELHESGAEQVEVGKSRPVHEAITYLENHTHRMRYAANRQRGLPIGSGPVEANAKSIYTVRMTRPGARWKPDTADHVLQLRAHHLGNRLVEAVNRALPPRQLVRAVA